MNSFCKFIVFATISANVFADNTDNITRVDVTCGYVNLWKSDRIGCEMENVIYTSKNPNIWNIRNASPKDVTVLRMIGGHYAVMPLNIFQVFPRVEIFNMQTGLTAITNENLIGGNRVRTLILSHNNITTVKSHTFDGMDNLVILLFTNNKLTKIESNAFSGATNLERLDLSSNEIDTIEDGAFNALKLTTINLANNKLTTLTDDVFAGCPELNHLYLYHNELTRIGKSINGENQLSKLSWISFDNENAKIMDLDFYAIARKPHLSGFDASGVGLVLDDPVSVANDTYTVDTLDISRNDLSYPDILNRLRNFRNLTGLRIGSNNFTMIDDIEKIKEIFPKLERLSVDEPFRTQVIKRLQTKSAFGGKVNLEDPTIYFD